MIKVKFEFYMPDEMTITYDEVTAEFSSWQGVMKFGEQHADTLMKFHNLEEVAWCYTVLTPPKEKT